MKEKTINQNLIKIKQFWNEESCGERYSTDSDGNVNYLKRLKKEMKWNLIY